MQTTTQILAAQRNGNLHVDIDGHLTPEAAQRLINTIARSYRGTGNIFIHTKRLTSVAPGAGAAFAGEIDRMKVPRNRLYLTGSRGLEISPDRSRVIVYEKKKGCCGRCRECKCGNENG